MKAVVVVPTYNERDNIESLIKEILAQQEKIPHFELHVLVSDSHSPDGTGEVVRALEEEHPKVHYLDVVERGIGVGLVKGNEYAIEKLGADVLVQIDADGQHDPKDIPRFLTEIRSGYDFVFGSRLIPGGENQIEWYRQIFTLGSSIACRVLTGLFSVHDFTPNFRAFTKELFLKVDKSRIPWRAKSFIIQPSFLYEAIKTGAKYKEIPIVFSGREAGYSKNKVIAYALDILRFGLKIRLEKSQTFLKFCVVGTIGFVINTIVLEVLVKFGIIYGLAAAAGAELAIVSNFVLNNLWTFAERKIPLVHTPIKFFQFNLASAGAVVIIGGVTQLGVILFEPTIYRFSYVAGVGLALVYNYTIYNRVVWRQRKRPNIT